MEKPVDARSTVVVAARNCGPGSSRCSTRCCRVSRSRCRRSRRRSISPGLSVAPCRPTACGSRSASARASISSGRPSSIRDVGLIGCEPYHQRRRQVPGAYRAHGRRQRAAVHRRCAPGDGRAARRARCRAPSCCFPIPGPRRAITSGASCSATILDVLAGLMTPGAELRLATDDPSYLPWMVEHACTHPAFEWLAERPADWRGRPADWPPTRYEQKMLAGHKPVFLRLVAPLARR